MRLHRLRITAFGPFGATQEVDFDDLSAAGLFLLHGPTGAGKTSVLDAVCYALYGSVPGPRQGGGQGATLRSDHASPDTRTEVCLELTVAGRRLEITRQPPWERPKKRGTGTTTDKAQSWLREYGGGVGAARASGAGATGGVGGGEAFGADADEVSGAVVAASPLAAATASPGADGTSTGAGSTAPGTGASARSNGWKDLSRSHQEIGEEITQLLGMSKEQFCQVVLLPQGDFSRFLRADAEARGKLLGRLFDTRRFAAVEARLAEQRRAAEAEVREGDAELLADAHRMQQAAGAGREGAELPLPDAAPGDPGLADAVLAWAAVARAGARERRDVARSALAHAESAHARAAAELDDVRELARLQRRFADATERAARLEARADEHRQLTARMERARKAETVAPALALRAEADEEHHRATAEEARARAYLPATYADEGAAGLAGAARRASEDLGGLAAARRAESRLTELTAQRADLDQQERADDELLAEAGGWLADWDARRTGLRDAVEDAQDATTRTEHLAGRLQPAQEKLDAARRRDRLAQEADAAQERALAAREHAGSTRAAWLDLKEQRLANIAAELAANLTDGAPCAVCGATEHPAPARKSAGHVDRAAEEAALAAHQRADEARGTAERDLAAVRESLAVATAAASDTPVAELAAAVEEVRHAHTEARARASRLHAAREELAQAEREHDRRVTAQQEAARRVDSRAAMRDALTDEQAGLEEELTRVRGGAASVAQRAAQLERQTTLLTAAADAARAADESAQRLKDADARLADAAFRAGFDTPSAASAALVDDTGHRELQHRIDAWQNEQAAVRALLAEPDAAAAARQPPARLAAAESAAETAAARVRTVASACDAAARRCGELDRLSARSAAAARRLAPLRETHDRVARLATLAAGTSADNERRMRLESYVLAARLEQVAAAATARLHRMSSGRYTLVHSDDRTGRGRSGLGLHVVDAWTGRERDASTLSGGETFFASLALALGLADVVTDEAGGVRLDTLFIDEGFGSLDDQTLDEVLDVLDALRERDRSVGIVSHVADLRRRVHAQLEVVKGRAGSVVRQRGGG
ncbi:AAA family ATPase [Streptomyces flavofungini]|uniref:Nuclease SbcCD subunit C n=1 Tax=Streptomyces flavofungini TaxID=68200 RepID=A0ABS0XB91_9ACTN|nr:SMC family ATPase [Streptomyces flavofungini]MBJ3810214.1 SMC family ATPase [Streptomyces flavofungini]GHC50188.1 nuclease SbcCD subunit C [Streptomyces flavofungini]